MVATRGGDDPARTSLYLEGINYRGFPIPFGARSGPIFATSGIPGSDPLTGEVPKNDARQVQNLFANMRRGIEGAGGTVDQILKCTFYIRDETVRLHINSQWEAMFPNPASRPARHTLMLQNHPLETAVMAEFIAVILQNGGGD